MGELEKERFQARSTFLSSADSDAAGSPSVRCSVLPSSRSTACGRISSTACSEFTAPAGLPGRFRTSDVPNVPQSPRLRVANGVWRRPSARINSGTPSSKRSQTARVASGVTSRSAIPVPPVVTTSLAASAALRIASSMTSCSSGTITCSTVSHPAPSNVRVTAGPERSSRKPFEHASLTVITPALRDGEVVESEVTNSIVQTGKLPPF